MTWSLPALFFVTAILYAAVGFGGGSTYNALLVLYGVDYRILPAVALACNIIVVTGGVWRFSKSGALSFKRLLPFVAASIPAAFIGGRLPISEQAFIAILGTALLLSGLRMLFLNPLEQTAASQMVRPNAWPLSALIGGAIGLISGLVGIGGGIFLAPILYFLKWGSARQIAAACSLFILLNSLSGLLGQVTKLNNAALLETALPFWPLLIAVFIGGQIGSWLGSDKLNPIWMKRMTAVLILYVAARLIWRWIAMF
jgi:hypothetical protein